MLFHQGLGAAGLKLRWNCHRVHQSIRPPFITYHFKLKPRQMSECSVSCRSNTIKHVTVLHVGFSLPPSRLFAAGGDGRSPRAAADFGFRGFKQRFFFFRADFTVLSSRSHEGSRKLDNNRTSSFPVCKWQIKELILIYSNSSPRLLKLLQMCKLI